MPSPSSRAPSSSASESSSSSQPDGHDFEPTSELKRQIKGKIEESMASMIQDADNIRAAQQKKASLGLLDPEQPTPEYKQTMARIKELAEERYHLELKIARERNKLRLKLAQVMKPSLSRHSPPSTTPPSRSSDAAEFEPDDEWKKQLKKKIEGELQSMVQAAKDTQIEELRRGPLSPSDRDRLELEHQNAMKNIRTIADEQYVAELNRERNQRRWVGGAPMDPRWVRVLHEEQEDILASIKQPRHSKSQSPSGRFATEIISEDNQDDIPIGRYKPTPSPLSRGKQREVLREEEEPESRDDSEEERSDDSDDSEELIEDEEARATRRARTGKFVDRNQGQPLQEDDFILLDARIIEEQERLLQQAQSRKRDEAFKLSHQQSHYRPREDEQQAQFRQREEEIKRRRAEERKRSATVSSDSSRWSGAPNSNPSTSPVTSSVLSNGVPKPTPQYNSASIWEKNLNTMSAWRTGPQAARPSSTKPAQVPARPSSTKPVGFAQSLPPARPWSVAPPHGRPRTLSATHQVVPFPAPVPIPTPGPGHSHHRSGSSGLSENMAKWARPSRQ